MKTLGISISLKTVDAPAVNAAGVFYWLAWLDVVKPKSCKKGIKMHKNVIYMANKS